MTTLLPVSAMPTSGVPTSGVAASGLLGEATLAPHHFERIAELLHDHAGIRMRAGKEGLVRARLAKRLRALGLTDFDAYLSIVEQEPSRREFTEMVDVLTTNKTSFFREQAHFDFLHDVVLPACPGPIRLWSAGCSSGEEPYTLAMLLNEGCDAHAVRSARILATDISHRVLATAKAGRYPADSLAEAPAGWLQKYWRPVAATEGRPGEPPRVEATNALRGLIQFGRLNLMEPWPMRGPFDAIFCRNVMIYFDKATQQELVNRYWGLLRPGGYLFVGHSESLTGLTHRFTYVQPAVYVR
jgi:chemotaxis protein methyltransferase CheR